MSFRKCEKLIAPNTLKRVGSCAGDTEDGEAFVSMALGILRHQNVSDRRWTGTREGWFIVLKSPPRHKSKPTPLLCERAHSGLTRLTKLVRSMTGKPFPSVALALSRKPPDRVRRASRSTSNKRTA